MRRTLNGQAQPRQVTQEFVRQAAVAAVDSTKIAGKMLPQHVEKLRGILRAWAEGWHPYPTTFAQINVLLDTFRTQLDAHLKSMPDGYSAGLQNDTAKKLANAINAAVASAVASPTIRRLTGHLNSGKVQIGGTRKTFRNRLLAIEPTLRDIVRKKGWSFVAKELRAEGVPPATATAVWEKDKSHALAFETAMELYANYPKKILRQWIENARLIRDDNAAPEPADDAYVQRARHMLALAKVATGVLRSREKAPDDENVAKRTGTLHHHVLSLNSLRNENPTEATAAMRIRLPELRKISDTRKNVDLAACLLQHGLDPDLAATVSQDVVENWKTRQAVVLRQLETEL